MAKPLKQYGNYFDFVTGYRIDKPPSIRKVVLP